MDVPKNDGTKASEEKTFRISADVAVTPTKVSLRKAAARRCYRPSAGIEVVQLSPDKSTVVATHARAHLHARGRRCFMQEYVDCPY